MKSVSLTEAAETDLFAAADFYELQEPGAGDLLFAGIFRCLRKLETMHGFHRMEHGFHKMLAGRFPHAIYYQIDEARIIVVAIIDLRRDPREVRRALTDRGSE